MIQTGLIDNAHNDLVTDAAYDFYGTKLATCSIDQRIKVWTLDEGTGTWSVQDEWRAHDAAVSKLSWAHPEFGIILASSSYDRTVKIWEHAPSESSSSPWVERAVLHEARGTVRSIQFAPHQFGLKLATISSDNYVRVYECLEQPSLLSWQVAEEIDILSLSPPSFSRLHNTQAVSTPLPISNDNAGLPSASLVAQALQNQGLALQQLNAAGKGTANKEADGGWDVSWCKDHYWGEVLAAAAGVWSAVKIIQLSPSKRPRTLLTLDPNPDSSSSNAPGTSGQMAIGPGGRGQGGVGGPGGHPHTRTISESGTSHPDLSAHTQPMYSVTSVAWAPSCGRSYHLVATGSRDGHVRIWKLRPPSLDDEDDDDNGDDNDEADGEGDWSALLVADFDQHKSAVGRVEWNITGTTLSSAGNDGCIRLWKATSGNVWRPAGVIGIEQVEELPGDGDTQKEIQGMGEDVEMVS